MIKSTGIVRKVDELGRVVLPIETRRIFGIEEKDGLEICVDEENGQIILRRAAEFCMMCRTARDLREVSSGFYLCPKCIEKLHSAGGVRLPQLP